MKENGPSMVNESQLIARRTDAVYLSHENELSFQDVRVVLKKHRFLILTLTLLAALLAGLAGYIRGDRFTAVGELQIQPGSGADLKQSLSSVLSSGEFGDLDVMLESDSRIIQSDTLLLAVVKKLNLQDNADFLNGKEYIRTSMFGGEKIKLHGGNLSNPRVREALLKIFRKNLTVERVPRTQMLTVSYKSRSAGLSASIVNALESEFIEHNFEAHYASTGQVTQWLTGQMEDLRTKVQKSQETLEGLEQKLGLFSLDPQHNLVINAISNLEKTAATATEERVASEARYRILTNLPHDQIMDSPTSVGTDFPTNLLANLRAQRAATSAELSKLTTIYGPNHPSVKQLRSQIDSLNVSIDAQQGRVVEQAKAAFDLAKQAETQAHDMLQAKTQDVFGQRNDIAKYEIASQEFDSDRRMYESIILRLREAAVDAGLNSADVSVVDLAGLPAEPSSLPPLALAAIGLGFGFMTAATIALFRDRMDTRMSDAAHVQEILGSPSLAVVPRLGSRSLIRKALKEGEPGAHPELIANPRSQFSESFRALRTAMRLSPLGREGRVIAVTSCQPREGKTTVSINMAVALAQSGKKVLLVDADMRLPSVQYRLRVNARPGLSEILSGQSTVNEAVLQDTVLPGLDLIVAGSIPPLPSELLGSSLMSEIVTDLRKKYDYVVFDTPPVLSVTDPAIVASLADGVLLVVRQGLCTRRMLTRSAETLRALEVRLYGFVFNGVDFALPEYYGYSGYYAYGAEPSVNKN